MTIQARLGLLLPLVILCGGGCSLFTPRKFDESLVLQSTAPTDNFQAVATAQQQNAIVLEVAGSKSGPKVIPLPPDGRPVYISDLLRQSGLCDTFPRMEAVLFRNSPTEINGIRMGVKFVPRSNKVTAEHDYALQAGDRLRVVEVELSPFEGFANMWSSNPNGRRAIVGF